MIFLEGHVTSPDTHADLGLRIFFGTTNALLMLQKKKKRVIRKE